ncbi:putative YigZ family protein [Microbacterium resistens]|uniref:YigZ family protein n=1 Tax=Microbacterium resistens TaxID=156977 RepID=A0ABU1SED0_9MICO|nr:YigZ family protein [Microbacterium resistens]MDR6867970.1 putative YigZ family protein [Microbacterium resistens]
MTAPSAGYPDTISSAVTHELVERKSRFIAHASPVSSVAAADALIASVRKAAWDASHHCTAMVLGVQGDQARSSDDGEPSGTAGVPMLEVLRRRRLTDVVLIVTRYFGGTKLGAGGLVRSYSSAASEVLDRARIVHRGLLRQVTIDIPHADAGRLDNMLRDWAHAHGATHGPTTYAASAGFELWVPPDALPRLGDDLAAFSSGTLRPVVGIDRIVDVPSAH